MRTWHLFRIPPRLRKRDVSDTAEPGVEETGGLTPREALPLLTEYLTEEEYAKADQWASSDDTNLAAVMRRAENGEAVTIAVIGGSITEGTISSGTKDSEVGFKKSYADIFKDWWETRFPNADITFVNAGIGGTDSYLGVHRLKSQVMEHDPDLVLVEFSVNDSDTVSFKKSYENIVRNILISDRPRAVMLLFMGQTNGSNAQGQHVMVGFNYSLPMVSYASAISVMMDSGHFTAEELSGDEVHPSALGHAVTGEILYRYLNDVYANMYDFGEAVALSRDTPALTSDTYRDADLLTGEAANVTDTGTFTWSDIDYHFTGGWKNESGEGGITFEVNFRNLGILYQKTTDGKSGKFDVLIDGETVRTIDADFTGGWGNAITGTEVYTSDEAAMHTVVIRKSEDSGGEQFKLIGLMTS